MGNGMRVDTNIEQKYYIYNLQDTKYKTVFPLSAFVSPWKIIRQL
jgi:hypothetical protein